jgi:(p)ppGpp synthase/HD superfamily hydrolase
MFKYAQTILQLNNQLRHAGYSVDEQRAVINAHTLAAELFSGRFRGCGKTFIAHLVGTASILVAHQASIHVVIAGLLHAAYEQGDFGHGLRRGRAHDRSELTSIIGTAAEHLVFDYEQLPWTSATISAYAHQTEGMTNERHDVLFIRMANELEEHLDCNILYCNDAKHRLQRLDELADTMVHLSRGLGFGALATELDSAFAQCQTEKVSDALPRPGSKSYLVPPRSFSRRYDNRLRTVIGRWRRILRST